ncbi:MAG TPA: hypothetical protein VG709_06835, partial [Actinomycetota bacterium]|nr:hypothetical protein [Actinomycetota bacterium]
MARRGRARRVLVVAIAASVATSLFAPLPTRAQMKGDPATVFGTGFDRGPVEATIPGLVISDDSAATVRWQTGVARTGTGAYHFVGGNGGADASIHNNRALPLGDLETWSGGAYRFVSFPREEASWLLVTAPTDGRAGANTKPVVSIDGRGRLLLSGGGRTGPVARSAPLDTNRWYYLMLHGRNGAGQRQELFVHDGWDGSLLERVEVTLDVTGDYRNPITKWGFGTVGDFTGLEYYLDDIFFAPGPANPGTVRVVTTVPRGTVAGGGFGAVGAP